MREWISVDDRLPYKADLERVHSHLYSKTVKIKVNRSPFEENGWIRYDYNQWIAERGVTYSMEEVTHWMPLSETDNA